MLLFTPFLRILSITIRAILVIVIRLVLLVKFVELCDVLVRGTFSEALAAIIDTLDALGLIVDVAVDKRPV